MKRNLIKLLFSLLAASLLLGSCCGKEQEKAKYIFLFIGDGMGNSNAAVAESYLSYKAGILGGKELVFTQFPYLGQCTTHSADKQITCSSAAGTAIACGEKTNNGYLGVNPEGEPLKSIAYDLKEDGYKIGILSSVPINHATPASFFAHNKSRGDYYSISMEIPQSGFDFFGGAGFLRFNGNNNDKEDTDAVLEKEGYTVCYGSEEFNESVLNSDKLILCQESNRKESAGNYTTTEDDGGDLQLYEMLQMGIQFLGNDKPFFIMCEGGDIDWAAHDNKTMDMVEKIIEFNNAVAVAYEFYKSYPDETLIIVTADHETGGVAIGTGSKMVKWDVLEKQWLESGKKNTLSREENSALNRECNIGWTTYDHAGSPVPVYSIGKGAERFMGRLDNTDIKGKILGE